jgi:hypothetical protein
MDRQLDTFSQTHAFYQESTFPNIHSLRPFVFIPSISSMFPSLASPPVRLKATEKNPDQQLRAC